MVQPDNREPTREEVDDLYGFEFEWFAQDETGAIGLFSTAGYGEIPAEVILQAQAHRALADSIPQPAIGTKHIWQDFAQVGLFVFDWQHWGGPYAKEASPQRLMAATLREDILRIPALPRLALRFSEVASVEIERFEPRQ